MPETFTDETQISQLVQEGKTLEEICITLHISASSVNAIAQRMLKKLGIKDVYVFALYCALKQKSEK